MYFLDFEPCQKPKELHQEIVEVLEDFIESDDGCICANQGNGYDAASLAGSINRVIMAERYPLKCWRVSRTVYIAKES